MHSIRALVIGGGPAGLFLARLLRRADPGGHVVLHERNDRAAAFGFGVVFSDRTMSAIEDADPQTAALITEASVSWTDLELRLPRTTLRYGGYGFTAISRRRLQEILQQQADAAGVTMVFHSGVTLTDPIAQDADVVAVADGVGSSNRDRYAEAFGSRVELGRAKFIWFGTPAGYDAVTFPFVRSEYGDFGAHAYPYGGDMSTFIVETDQSAWLAAGLDAPTAAVEKSGDTDEYSRRFLSDLFREHLDGHELIGNNSKWANFRLVHSAVWSHRNAVLLGDAAHTAHFSVGSGTKLAMEDAIALTQSLLTQPSRAEAFTAYERLRRPAIARTRLAAEPSMRWWEDFPTRLSRPAEEFGMHFVTRTAAITYAGLRRRHADRIDAAEAELTTGLNRNTEPSPDLNPEPSSEPSRRFNAMRSPLRIKHLTLASRLVTATFGSVAQQCALARLHAAAGSALVLAEWTSAESTTDLLAWGSAADQVLRAGTAFGVTLPSADATVLIDDAVAIGATVLEVLLAAPAQVGAVPWRSRAIASAPVMLAGYSLPVTGAWSAEAEDLLHACRDLAQAELVDGVHLRVPGWKDAGVSGSQWQRVIAQADRIRSHTGLPVLVDGPRDWALDVSGPGDDWPTRMHLAVLTGRADLVAGWPLPTPTVLTPRERSDPQSASTGPASSTGYGLESGAR